MVEEKLKSIKHFQIHPTLLPHVGEQYDKFRIALIGESHYLQDLQEGKKYPPKASDYVDWYDSRIPHGIDDETWKKYEGYFNTRDMIRQFVDGDDIKLLKLPAEMFADVLSETHHAKTDSPCKLLAGCCAFFQYFQRPSLPKVHNGLSWKQLVPDEGQKTFAIVKEVLDILKPNLVFIISKKSSDAFKYWCKREYDNIPENIYFLYHTGYGQWNRKDRLVKGTTSGELFRSILCEYMKEII